MYPAFAKAAGVQGAVTIHVGIGTTGRIGALMEMAGPSSLKEAAQNAVLQYEYKPFEKDGQAVAADTTITVVFKLEGNVSPPPPPPDISDSFKAFERPVRLDRGRYAGFKCTDCVVTISPVLRKWLASDLKKQIDHLQDGFESSSEFLSLEAELQNTDAPLPVAIELIEVQSRSRARISTCSGIHHEQRLMWSDGKLLHRTDRRGPRGHSHGRRLIRRWIFYSPAQGLTLSGYFRGSRAQLTQFTGAMSARAIA